MREVAPHYDANIFFAMRSYGDFLECPACGWRQRYANDIVRKADKVSHATPVNNPDPLDIACPEASWSAALATLEW